MLHTLPCKAMRCDRDGIPQVICIRTPVPVSRCSASHLSGHCGGGGELSLDESCQCQQSQVQRRSNVQAHHDIAVCHSWEIQVSRSASRRSGEPRMFWILDYHLIQNELVPSITVSTGHNGPSVAHLGAARARSKASKLPEWYHTVSGGSTASPLLHLWSSRKYPHCFFYFILRTRSIIDHWLFFYILLFLSSLSPSLSSLSTDINRHRPRAVRLHPDGRTRGRDHDITPFYQIID